MDGIVNNLLKKLKLALQSQRSNELFQLAQYYRRNRRYGLSFSCGLSSVGCHGVSVRFCPGEETHMPQLLSL